jgi:DnaJ-class molecular chaperone
VSATIDEVKEAYRRQAIECGPDRAIENGLTVEENTDNSKELTAAYSVCAAERGART